MTEWNIKNLLDWTTQYFLQRHFESSRLEAEVLLAHVLKCRRLDLYLKFDMPVLPNDLSRFKELIKRRAQSEPLAYITESKEFLGRHYFVSPAVLIPRPETEQLVEEAIKRLKVIDKNELIGCDVGVGSGVIGISMLCDFKSAIMDGFDISQSALSVAKKNAQSHGVLDRYHLAEQDILALDKMERSYDFIISNPPYIKTNVIKNLEETVKNHEPHLALDGGHDGLNYYRKISKLAYNSLTNHGFLFFEIGDDQGADVLQILKNEHFKHIDIMKDYSQNDRIVVAKKE